LEKGLVVKEYAVRFCAGAAALGFVLSGMWRRGEGATGRDGRFAEGTAGSPESRSRQAARVGADAKDLKAEINGLHRDASGLTTLVWTVKNRKTSASESLRTRRYLT
jgi:hypothetical protein